MALVLNASTAPLIVDEVGHVIGVGETRDGVDVAADPAAAHLAAGRLLLLPDPRVVSVADPAIAVAAPLAAPEPAAPAPTPEAATAATATPATPEA